MVVAQVRKAIERDGVGPCAFVVTSMVLVALGGGSLGQSSLSALGPVVNETQQIESLISELDSKAQAAPAEAMMSLQRAFLESLKPGALNESAINAIRRSYILEPLGPDATVWRLRFVFNHWAAMPQDVRENARAELNAAFPRHGWAMRELPQTVNDPTGRMVATLMFDRLRDSQAAATQNQRQNVK